jgi:uncharacterized protein YneF (UPF0154 family)
MKKNQVRQEYSTLEKELRKQLEKSSPSQIAQIRSLMLEMAEKSSSRVVISTYPACNSEV